MYSDPLERKPGEALDPRWKRGELESIELGSRRTWSSLFQQNPRTIGGNLIKIDNFISIKPEEIPAKGMRWCRAWDLAFSEKQIGKSNPSFTVGAKVGLYTSAAEYYIIIANIVRWQATWPVTKHRIAEIAKEDTPSVKLVIETGGPQKGLVDDLRSSKEFATYSIMPCSPESQDKIVRANYWTEKLEMGKIKLVTAVWNRPFLDECEIFNNGVHNDQVDAISIAYWWLKRYIRGNSFQKVHIRGFYR